MSVKIDWSSLWKKEDWWALWLGLLIFFVACGLFGGVDTFGWAPATKVWIDIVKSNVPISKAYAWLNPVISIIAFFILVLGLATLGAYAMGFKLKRFVAGFTIIFWLSFICWLVGHYAYIAATPDVWKAFGISWSLSLTGEAGYLFALIFGLIIGNFIRPLARFLQEAARPEWYIKTAIVCLGALIGVKSAEAFGVAFHVVLMGFCAIIVAYLLYWPLVYIVARMAFKFDRAWSACLASGIAICGVSAAIATAGAIRAPGYIPITIASLVVIWAVVELVILPWIAAAFLWKEPMVAGTWMGLAVKTDGAAAASAAITDALIRAKAISEAKVAYDPGWMLMGGVTTKVLIDLFIGIWAFVLACIWVYSIERKPGERVSPLEIWFRFPKFVLGYFITWIALMVVGLSAPALFPVVKLTGEEVDVFRKWFFLMTFMSIGLITDFRKFIEWKLHKLVICYVVSLFGFIIWIGLAISWIFFHGVYPPWTRVS